MRFTEDEFTAALTGAAKAVLTTQRKDFRRGRVDIDDVWAELDRYERFQLLDQLGAQILPVLVALPDVEVSPGTRPSYTNRQVSDTIETLWTAAPASSAEPSSSRRVPHWCNRRSPTFRRARIPMP